MSGSSKLPILDNGEGIAQLQCLFGEHAADMIKLQEAQVRTAGETAKLTVAQERLSTVLESLNKNLDNGFKLGGQIVSLFARVVLVFLLVVGGLCGVIVYITQIKMEIPGVKLEPRVHVQVPAPVVEIVPPSPVPTPSPTPGRRR